MTQSVTVDARGESCPVPVTRLAQAIARVPVGTEVEVLADDPGAAIDIPVWCRMKAQTYLGAAEAGSGCRYRVRRTS
jgi:tRNA 2-thiouridine synthesizing protein A